MGLKIGLCQMQVHPGEPERNAKTMLGWMAQYQRQVDLLVFPEMCIPGYMLGDAWERPAFLRECEYWTKQLITASKNGPTLVFGTVAIEWDERGEDGRPRKFNAWVVAAEGKAMMHPTLGKPYGIKSLLPNYREFEDSRHFYDTRKLALESGRTWSDFVEPLTIEIAEVRYRIGIVICEDTWEDDYAQRPMEVLAQKRCDFTLNLSGSPYTRGKSDKRHRVFGAKAKLTGAPLFYVNAVGIQNNGKTLFTFDGCSTVYAREGIKVADLPPFVETVGIVEYTQENILPLTWPNTPVTSTEPFSMGEVYGALRYGAEQFLDSIGCRKVVVGISGGIDSAVAAALYRVFLGPQELLLVNMPSRFNSKTTKSLAKVLAQNLDCLYAEIPIEDSVTNTLAQFKKISAIHSATNFQLNLPLEGLLAENVQARDRGARVLAAVAAAFGGVFSCNTNKAEMTVGYGTLYGDIAGHLAVLGDLWKEDVYSLGRHLNQVIYGREVIPEGIFHVTPSAELSEAQAVDEGKGDPLIYPYHDKLFFAFVQHWNRVTPEEILTWYLDGTLSHKLELPLKVDLKKIFLTPVSFCEDLEKWWKLYSGIGVAKRVQAPPILAVSSRSFGFDHREYLGRTTFTQKYLELKVKALAKN